MAQKIIRGIFITFEGPEGSGKSTQSKGIYEDLIRDGYDVLHTREPGGSLLGEKIREILLAKDSIPLSSESELLLFEAQRAQHISELIKPAIDQNKIVLCDRFNTATFAYQGYGLGMSIDDIKKVDSIATYGISPDLTILLDLDTRIGLERAEAKGTPDRMEKRSIDFHNKVRQGYLLLAEKNPDKIKKVSVEENKEDTYKKVKMIIYDFIERYKRK